jgi:phthiodiolone/phenolphthiodiolone dimycocerosates ketoreductase
MQTRLAVGIETGCTAPLGLETAQQRVAVLMGVDSLLLPDHYQGFVPRPVWDPATVPAAKLVPSPDAFFDPFVMLGRMATKFRRVRIGTGVTEAFRRHPTTLAQAFVTLDHLTRGRAILGIGNGERENCEPYGLPFTKRVGRLEEALEVMTRLWRSGGEPIDFDGTFWRLRKAVFRTPLYAGRAPCVWIASHAPRMLALTGRYADGWYPTMKMTAAEYGERLGRIHAAAAAAGRDVARFEPALQIQLALGSDRATMLDQLRRLPVSGALTMLLPGGVWAKHGLRHPLGADYEGFAQFVPEEISAAQIDDALRQATPELLGDGVYAGSIDEVVRELAPLVDAGMRHVVIWNIGALATGGKPIDFIRLAILVRRLRRLRVRVDAPGPPSAVRTRS